ncbi:MAG TPA: hypothetical protein VKQ36_15525 [Ktedonobacterales bacterium]|nr:hypothetical protein [Ktedonobacterales bacterium]
MITCPRCGLSVYPHTQICPRCQLPLAAPAPGNPYAGVAPGDDIAGDNVPEWVRVAQGQAYNQQRSNLPPGAAGAPGSVAPPPPQPRGAFSLSDMISEENLPEWLRGSADTPGAPANGYSNGSNGGNGRQAQQPQPAQPPQSWQSPWGVPAADNPATSQGLPGNGGFTGGYPPSSYLSFPADPRATGNMASLPASSPPPAAGAPGASAASLLDESALPDWLLQASANGQQHGQNYATQQPQAPAVDPASGWGATPAGQPAPGAMNYPGTPGVPALEPSTAFPPIDQIADGRRIGAPADQLMQGEMDAQSLLDPRALPGWLGGPGDAAPYTPPSGRAASMGMQAGSLVDEHALPQWLRNEPATPSQRVPAVQPGTVSRWITGASDEPLPPWLNQVYSDARVAPTAPTPQDMYAVPPPSYGSPAGAPGYGQPPTAGAADAPAGIAARQFVEESALPEWLRAQGATAVGPSAPAAAPGYSPAAAYQPNQPAGQNGQMGAYQAVPSGGQPDAQGPLFSASDLIDPDALPSWAQGSAQNGGTAQQGALRPPASPQPSSGSLDPTGGATGRIAAAAGWEDNDATLGPGAPTGRHPTTLGEAVARSGRHPVPPGAQPGQPGRNGASSRINRGYQGDGRNSATPQTGGFAPPQQPQSSPGRMRLDDLPSGAISPQGQGAASVPRRQGGPQRGQGTGALRQPPPEQQLGPGELPGWLRAGAGPHPPYAANASNDPHGAGTAGGYGQGYDQGYAQGSDPAFAGGAQPDPIWDDADWGLPPSEEERAGPAQYRARNRPAAAGQQGADDRDQGRQRGSGEQPRKRGWRRIFGGN